MIEALGITLREAIEAILVIFIMAAYLEKTGQGEKKRHVYGGALAAVSLSVVLAVVLSGMGIEPENELVEGILFIAAGLMVASLVVWMARKSKTIKGDIEAKTAGASSSLALAGIAFVMVFREGIETVIFFQSLLLAGSSPVENFIGGVMGIALAVVFGMVFLKGTARINLSRFFRVTSAILAVLVVKLIASGLHEFFEVGLLPTTQGVMSVVGVFARDSTGSLIIVLMLAGLMATVIYDVARAKLPDISSRSKAEMRKVKHEFLKEKYTKVALGAFLVLAIGGLMVPTIVRSDVETPSPQEIEAQEGLITLEVPEEDGLYRYSLGEVRFLMAVSGGKPHVALDRCYICPPKGYGYNGEALVCLNCGAPIAPDSVGMEGGCNPVVLNYTVTGNKVELEKEEVIQAWKKFE